MMIRNTLLFHAYVNVSVIAALVSGQNLTIEAPKEVEPMDWVNVTCTFIGVNKPTEAVLYQDGHKLENVSRNSHVPHEGEIVLTWTFNIMLAYKEMITTLQCKDVDSIMESDIVNVSVRLRPMLNISSPLKVHTRSSLNVTCHLSCKLPLYDVVILLQDGKKVETDPGRTTPPNKTEKDPYLLEVHFNIMTPDVPGRIQLQCFMKPRNISSESIQVEILQFSAASSHMGTEAKIGVGIGVGILLVIGVVVLVYCLRKKKMSRFNDSVPSGQELRPLATVGQSP